MCVLVVVDFYIFLDGKEVKQNKNQMCEDMVSGLIRRGLFKGFVSELLFVVFKIDKYEYGKLFIQLVVF